MNIASVASITGDIKDLSMSHDQKIDVTTPSGEVAYIY